MALRPARRQILRAHGESYEGDVFCVLKQSPYTVRSAEFGLGDGSVDCSRAHPIGSSWMERYWNTYERRYSDPSDLLLFEVKSTVGEKAGDQIYKTTLAQRHHVAFYIGVVAAEPGSVDLIPNYHQSEDALRRTDDKFTSPDQSREAATIVNVKRKSYLPPSAYGGVDQCLAPYRMPIALLPEAIARVRRCALGGGHYINPWTKVEFEDWLPRTTTQMRFLRPNDDADLASAFEASMEIYRVLHQSPSAEALGITMDFMGMQPRLADFKFILSMQKRQCLIQHKLDTPLHSTNATLHKVPIARDGGPVRQHYFSATAPFDFLWYQFDFARAGGEVERIIYFIPERELPEEIFTSEESQIDFESFPHFLRFKIVMDNDHRWITAIYDIMVSYPEPKAPGRRPIRESRRRVLRELMASEEAAVEAAAADIASPQQHGRHLFAREMKRSRRRFFYEIMTQCAHRRSGLLLVLATEHMYGDFGYCRYRWSAKEVDAFRRKAKPPRVCHQLPADTEILPVFLFAQHAEATFQGPNLRAKHFRRIDATPSNRLTIWDIGGPDTASSPPQRYAVVPTADLRPTDRQRDVFEQNLKLNKKREFEKKNPNLSSLLSTALHATEYGVGPGGPLVYDEPGGMWAALWALLDSFATQDVVQHPPGLDRRAETYRHTLQSVHQSLLSQLRLDDENLAHDTDSDDEFL